MEKLFIDILPKISNWDSITYSPDLNCPECGQSGLFDCIDPSVENPYLIGWCETNNGYMIVLECSKCFKKFRIHGHAQDRFDKDLFDYYVGSFHVEHVANGQELKDNYNEYCKKDA